MSNIRRAKIFNGPTAEAIAETPLAVFFFATVITFFVLMFGLAMPLDTATPLPTWLWLFAWIGGTFLISTSLAFVFPNIGTLHRLNQRDRLVYDRYYSLTKEARLALPSNFLDVYTRAGARDKTRISNELAFYITEAGNAQAARTIASRDEVDNVLEALGQEREYEQIKTETYEEYR